MNVGELIAELKKYDPDLDVICSAEGGHVEVNIDWVCPLDQYDKVTDRLPHSKILLGEN